MDVDDHPCIKGACHHKGPYECVRNAVTAALEAKEDTVLLDFWSKNPWTVSTHFRTFFVWDICGELVDKFDTARLALKAAMVVALMKMEKERQ